MNTVALPNPSAKQAPARAVEKQEDRTHLLTERLKKALEDVNEGRVHTISPKNHKNGFQELVREKRAKKAK
jgi:hypothetical protein